MVAPNPFIHQHPDPQAAGPQSQVNPYQSQSLQGRSPTPQPLPPQSGSGIFHPTRQRPLSWGCWSPIQPKAPPYRPAEDRRENQGQVLVSFSLGRHQEKVQERTPTPLPGAPQPSLAVRLLCLNLSLLPSLECPPDGKGAGAPCLGPESQALCVFQRAGQGFQEEAPERGCRVVRATSSPQRRACVGPAGGAWGGAVTVAAAHRAEVATPARKRVLTGQHQGGRWEAAGMSVPKVPLVSAQLLPGQKLLILRQ